MLNYATFYKQIFGTPMGSPLSSLFVDIVMEDLEIDCFIDTLEKKFNCHPCFFIKDT